MTGDPGSIHAVTMPRWGLTMEDGIVTSWLFQVGDRIEAGQEIIEIESTKISGAVEAMQDGMLRQIVIAEGENVPVGSLLGLIADEDVSEEALSEFASSYTIPETTDCEVDEPTLQEVEVNGRTLTYLKMGEGAEKVLFIHGFGGDLAGWGMVQQTLADHAETYAINLPGHGSSSKLVKDPSVAGLADVVHQFIQELELESVHVVGHSMGAAVALTLTQKDISCVASLTLLAPAGLGTEINVDYLDAYIASSRSREVRNVLKQLFHDESLASRTLAEDVLKYKRLDGTETALRAIRDAFINDDGKQELVFRDQLAAISISITVVWGEDDRIIAPAALSEGLAPTVKVILLQNVGHMPQAEAPTDVSAAIIDTL